MTQEQCNDLGKLILPNWQDVARKLLFSMQDIKGIEAKYAQNLCDQSIEMLHRWLNRNGSKATVFILCKTLISSDARNHAESVFGGTLVQSIANVLDYGSAV